MISIFFFLYCAFSTTPINLIQNADFLSSYPMVLPYNRTAAPFNYTYKFWPPDGIWYSNDSYKNSFQIRTVEGFSSLFIDTIGTDVSTSTCQQISIPSDGVYTLNFTYTLDKNLLSAALVVMWNST